MRCVFNIITSSVVRHNVLLSSRRNFLSTAFECQDSWNNRLADPVLSRAKSENLYYELMSVYNKTRKINPIDVDVFVNIQTDNSFITEVEELVHKLRLTSETMNTLPTTHHAFIRLFWQFKKNDLIRILNDRLHYGVFPDHYCYVYLLNKFMNENDFRNAAKIASLQMIQEDFSHDLVNYMSVYAILRYLESKEPWEDIPAVEPKSENDDEEEEIKVRVKCLRNPFFDDHFDLTDGHHICGKSLRLIAPYLENKMQDSLKIMGLALHNKWDRLENQLIESLANQRENPEHVIFTDALKFTEDVLNSKLEDADKLNTILNNLKQIYERRCISESLIEHVKRKLEEKVKVYEKDMIQLQEKLYKDWAVLREEKLQQFLAEMNTRKRLEEVERKKDELKKKEELLYYFDNEEEIELVIKSKMELIKKRTWAVDEKKLEEDYVPPEVKKRVT